MGVLQREEDLGYDTTKEIFRMDGICIVEYSDIIQDLPADAINPLAIVKRNGRPYIIHSLFHPLREYLPYKSYLSP
jgi:hypothetical protein